MEVDPPTSSSSSPVPSTLKRSNSAPMINMLVSAQADVSPPSMFKPTNCTALRRLSSSNMALNNCSASTSPPIRGPDRVARIKQEEIHIADRERDREREIQSSFWISNNWGNLSLDSSEPMDGQQRRPRSYSESLHILTQSNMLCGSPSPTRAGIKQCFSPSMQIPVKNTTFTPSPSPSPTRKNFFRSLSPIAVRTGSMKRKLENEGDRWEYISPAKKFNTGPGTPDRIMTCSHPLAHSISSSSLEGSSPEQSGLSRTSGNSISGPNLLHVHSSLGGRSPHSLTSLGGHSPLSSSSGAPSPHSTMSGGSGNILPPALISNKQAFMFRPVTEAMGSPSSSTSSSSSSSMSLHHLHPLQDGQQQQQQQQQQLPAHHHQHQDRSPLGHSAAGGASILPALSRAAQPHHRMSSESSECSHHNNSDVCMSDSEMRDHSDLAGKPDGTTATSVGFNFKPISPDHT